MNFQETSMTLSDFDYHLPQELIAAFPPDERTSARLLNAPKPAGPISHHRFCDIERFLSGGDVLILNNTKVIPARLFGKKESGGVVEVFLLKELQDGSWEALLRPSGRVKKEATLSFEGDGVRLTASILNHPGENDGKRLVRFEGDSVRAAIDKIGHMPLPPYLDREDVALDREYYQTVFAEKEGAVASPTAGLHFDQALLARLKQKGIQIGFITLHVSYSTFRPIAVEDLSLHRMFEEDYEVSEQTAECVNTAIREKRRIIACGTTSVRALESAVDAHGKIIAKRGATTLFIYPPYEFKIVSGMITNFHLPKSTLLLLVAAFLGGRERLFEIYREAIQQRYNFYSYGDAMLIL